MKNALLQLTFFSSIVSSIFCISCSQKAAVSTSGGGSTSVECGEMTQNECAMLVAINEERSKVGMPVLKPHNTCTVLARDHAVDMVARNFFGHDSPTETFRQRITRYGLSGGWVGENIARNAGVAGAVSQWMNSPGHKANILNTNYRSTGIGFYNNYWVQCFTSMTN